MFSVHLVSSVFKCEDNKFWSESAVIECLASHIGVGLIAVNCLLRASQKFGFKLQMEMLAKFVKEIHESTKPSEPKMMFSCQYVDFINNLDSWILM